MNEVLIYSDIGESLWSEGATASNIKAQLKGDVTVRINSAGGDVFEGFAIYNLLKAHDGKVRIVVDGLAASAASIIAMAGDEIIAPATSMLMIHDPWTMAGGNAEDLLATAELLEKVKASIIPAYVEKTGLSEDAISDMMSAETWMTGTEALNLGFITSTTEATAPKIENVSKVWIKNAPQQIQETEEAAPQEADRWRSAIAARKLALIKG